MARIRSLKPEFFRSRSLARCSRDARLTFQGLWIEADDAGNGIADARILKGAIWPLDDDITWEDVERHLGELAGVGAVRIYDVEGERYYTIPNWEKHQSAAYRRGEAKYPLPSASDDTQPARENVQDARGSVLEGKGREGSREQGEVLALLPAARDGSRRRDVIWEAVLAVCGVDPGQVTDSARGAYNKAVKSIRNTGADPDAVAARAWVFRERWPDASLTPTALARRWGECDPDRQHAPVERPDPAKETLRRSLAKAEAEGL